MKVFSELREADRPLIAAAIRLGDWILTRKDCSSEDVKSIHALQGILRKLPEANVTKELAYWVHMDFGTPVSTCRTWSVEVSSEHGWLRLSIDSTNHLMDEQNTFYRYGASGNFYYGLEVEGPPVNRLPDRRRKDEAFQIWISEVGALDSLARDCSLLELQTGEGPLGKLKSYPQG